MGELIDFSAILKRKQLEGVIGDMNERIAQKEIPSPEKFGWKPVDFEGDTPVQYFNPEYRASIGYIPGTPEYVYVDYNNKTLAYSLTLEELALGIEFGTLDEPEFEVKF